ncbi:MAG TPA: bifunctional 4-hydroxy-2-oxoglutarate aldolase/2-dehydro-3-deoxy-phosphogluconate aldolase [Polyangiaceae bacterium]|nr:bifunctional 4-hydroxy-2-oxoglutarate aldolase/2-dehydro-3-deoxy-phosphogluconate aldolase [Polyangiaceae bacterium]
MSGVEAALQALGAARLVAVLRADSGERACQLVEAVIDGGIRAVEVTLTVPEAEDVIRWAGQRFGASVQVGAGSVLDAAAARRVIAAGARFVVSPILDAGVLDACRGAGVLGVPGCFTPTEIVAATRAGAPLVKVFPAGRLGPSYVKDLLGPLPGLRLMPTGGVSVDNVGSWLGAGAFALGVGSALCPDRSLAEARFDRIRETTAAFVSAVARYLGSPS